MDASDKIKELQAKIDALLRKQNYFFSQIKELRQEVHSLKSSDFDLEESSQESPGAPKQPSGGVKRVFEVIERSHEEVSDGSDVQAEKPKSFNPNPPSPVKARAPKGGIEWEKFIGENLINKIGIAILVIGVGIGAKYAIDHDLISPLTRIILGYLIGFGLLVFAAKLKSTFENFSAVLLSGSAATMYLVTLNAYQSYQLIPQTLAFAIMAILTAFTVLAALKYDRQVIAVIGLVGAYAVPYLLSDDSGQVGVLFTYTAIINVGIMFLALKKYWKTLYHSAFVLTMLIYLSWFALDYNQSEHFSIALVFLSVFFFTFYTTFIAYKLVQNEKFQLSDIVLLLINSFIFYGIGYLILEDHETGSKLLGLFTLANAIIHFGVSIIIYRQKLADKNLFYLIAGLVLVFFTIAIPVQLDGQWVTTLWVVEAAILFWIGRTKNVQIYEMLSYPVLLIASLSLLQDWPLNYSTALSFENNPILTPIFNINFLGSAMFIGAMGFMNKIHLENKTNFTLLHDQSIKKLIGYALPTILIASIFGAFVFEIKNYWYQLYASSAISVGPDSYMIYRTDIPTFEALWIMNYSLLFMSIFAFVNLKKLRNKSLVMVNVLLIILAIFGFLTVSIESLHTLRSNFIDEIQLEYFSRSSTILGFRYLCFAFVALAIFSLYRVVKAKLAETNLSMLFDITLHLTILIIISDELFNWLNIYGAEGTFNITLSILWGLYALALILFGIRNGKRYLRIGGIGLFGVTLIKVFIYDISNLESGAKTIVLISLGVLLLVISFLYNKYKNIIFDESEN